MHFRHAAARDADTVLALYRSVLGTPFCVWNEYYPEAFDIRNDLAHDDLFVLTEENPAGDSTPGEVIGAVSIVPENETAGLAPWTGGEEESAELARVVIRPDRQGRGLSSLLVTHIGEELRARGIRYARLLVEVGHVPAYRTYMSCGFRVVGECDAYGHHYYACEKKL